MRTDEPSLEADLRAAIARVGDAQDELDEAIRTARNAGLSWTRIGRVFGVTKQTAWERWRHLDGLDVSDATDSGRPK